MGASPSKRIQPGNIQEGNSTVIGEIPLANSSSRRSSTITLNPSQKTSSNVRFVPPTNGILRTARPSPPRLQTITPISPIRSRSSSLTSLPNPPLSRTASPVSISNSNYNNNSTGVVKPIGLGKFNPEFNKALQTGIDQRTAARDKMQANVATLPTYTKKGVAEGDVDEAKYQGREVPLGKKMAGDVKKSKVYVRKPNGNIVKVNFGDKKMRIKKSNPARRKSFRARHNCANPGPRHKARYWSCRSW